MVLVSVIMNAYNHEKYISEAIESVLNQTFTDFELIIIEDASKRNARHNQKLSQKDNRIPAIFHAKNIGYRQNPERMLHRSQRQIHRVHKLRRRLVNVQTRKAAGSFSTERKLCCLVRRQSNTGTGAYRGFTFTQMHNAQGKQKSGNILLELIEDNFVFTQSLIYKTEYAQKIGYDTRLKYLNDYKFLVELAAQHEFLYIPQPLAKYRVHGKNSICRDETDWLKDRVALRTFFLQKYDNLLSNSLKANLCLKIGEAYAGLGHQEAAKRFFLKAIRYNFASKETILYLNHALTNADGWVGNVLLLLYLKVNSLLLRRRQNK